MISYSRCAILMFFVTVQVASIMGQDLTHIINELNERLRISTNIIYYKNVDSFKPFESYISSIIYTSLEALNITSLRYQLGSDYKLFIIMGNDPPYEFLRKLELRFQQADFLLVIDNKMQEDKWKHFINFAWQIGYVKILIHSTYSGNSYDKILFPKLRIKETTIKEYANFRDSFQNVDGHKVRVAAYNNVPRTLIYFDRSGKKIYAGYFMRFAKQFLDFRNATFQPVHTPNDSPQNCTDFLRNNTVDLCADALVRNPDVFSLTRALRISAANVIVPHSKPLLSYRYLTAPFKTQVWIYLAMYIILISVFLCLIHWKQSGRFDFSQTLLEVFSSLLYLGFHLKAIKGLERTILFAVLFISGFVYSTMYLGLLKSMLVSEVFEKQIESFEELAERNIPLLIDPYDRMLFMRHHIPKPLWNVIETVSTETLVRHRNNFNQDYAYVLFADRMDMFVYAQQFSRHQKFRRIPINFCFLIAGFPMNKKWFLKNHLSRAWFHGFESGLLDKMARDAQREAVSQGYLNFTVTKHWESGPLGIDYFIVPAISLALGYSFAILTFGIEITIWKIYGYKK